MSDLRTHDVDVRTRDGGHDGSSRPVVEDVTVTELLSDLSRDVSELFRTQAQLAIVEMKDEARQAGRAAGFLGAGAVLGNLTLLLLSFTAVYGLGEWLDLWISFLIVAICVGVAASIVSMRGRAELQATDPVPRQTMETLEDDARWLREQRS